MDSQHLWLAFSRLENAASGGRMENLPLDPARRHISMKLRREKGEAKDFSHAFDVLMDFLRILELEIDGYRRPYLALRLERMEDLGLLSSSQALELWKQRASLAREGGDAPAEADHFFTSVLSRIRNLLESRFPLP